MTFLKFDAAYLHLSKFPDVSLVRRIEAI